MSACELETAFTRAGGRGATGAELEAFYAGGRRGWPDVEVPAEAVVVAAAARLRNDSVVTLGELDSAELYIAAGCSLGLPSAIASFEARYFDVIDPTLRTMGLSGSAIDDIKQGLRARLFVGPPGTGAKILQYAGTGGLRGLVRVSATRDALCLLRGARRRPEHSDDELLLNLAEHDPDPALQLLRQQQREDLVVAFRHAFQQLSARERNLIRLHFVKAVPVERLGVFYGVHRTTAHRWLCRARDALGRTVRQALSEQWKVLDDGSQLIDLIESQLDLSISSLLMSATG